MAVKYNIRLSDEEQQHLKQIVKSDKIARYKRIHAQILLSLDKNGPSLSEMATKDICCVSVRTVQRVRQRCVEEGLEVAIESKKYVEGRPRKLDGDQQARLASIACSEAPEGACRWTMQLLADKLVELDVTDAISPSTVT